MCPELDKLKSKAFRVSVNDVVWVSPPPTPVMLITNWPVGVLDEVVMTRVNMMGGVTVQVVVEPPQPEPPSNMAVAPLGSPLTESVTDCAGPLTRVTVIVLDPEPPGLTAIPPLFDKEKSKPLLTLSVNCNVSVSPPPTPATVTAYNPGGVDDEVVMVRVTEEVGVIVQVGWPVQPLKNAEEAPVGSPLTESVTGCAIPLTRVTLIVLEPELP